MASLVAAAAILALVTAEPLSTRSGSSNFSSSSSSSSASSSQSPNEATQIYLAKLNTSLGHNYLYALAALVVFVFICCSLVRLNAHLRHLASFTGTGAQRYFTVASPSTAWIKSHIFYAPIFHHKRATELKLSSRITLGTLPTRFQAIFITSVLVYNIFACTWNVPWSDPDLQALRILRARTGSLSVVNLIPIMVFATIKNPLISLLGIPYDTFNLMHRWLGRMSILQAVAHSLCYLIPKIQQQGWTGVNKLIQEPFLYQGVIATGGFIVIFCQSPKLFRSLAYEVFYHVHLVIVIVSLIFLWMHLEGYPQQNLLLAAICIWLTVRTLRFATLAFRSIGKDKCTATIEALPGRALRVSLVTPRPWFHQPGQSVYLTIPAVGWLIAHPFSVAWSDIEVPLSRSSSVRSGFDEKKALIWMKAVNDDEESGKQTFSLVVKARGRLTQKLYERAERAIVQDGRKLSLTALVEGPYGSERNMSSYGNVMLFASGVGITHQIPYVKQLIEGYSNQTVATRRIMLIWVIPNTECLEWIRPWMNEILGMENRREVLKVLLYITRATLTQNLQSPSDAVRMLRGRPDVEGLMRREANELMGCMGVSVCAGGGLADEVRRVSRLLSAKEVNLDFIEEGFGW